MSLAAVMSGGVAFADEPPAQYSVDDVVKSFSADAGSSQPAPQPGEPQGECEKRGMFTDEDGLCEPAKNTRGWSIPGAATAATSSSAVTRPRASASSASTPAARPVRRPAVAAAQTARRDLLISFRTGSAELTEQARANAQVFAKAINLPQLQTVKFEIAGHTDAVGGRDKNLPLSQQRAEAVRAYLVSLGVDSARLMARGYGFDNPVSPGNLFAAANRRVEAKRLN